MENVLIKMYLAGVSVRQVEDIEEVLLGSKVSSTTINERAKDMCQHRRLKKSLLPNEKYLYVYMNDVYLHRNRAIYSIKEHHYR